MSALTIGDGLMKLWSLENGEQLAKTMPLDDGEDVDGFIVSSSSKLLLTWDSNDGVARLRSLLTCLRVGAAMRDSPGIAVSEELGLIITEGGYVWDGFVGEPIDFKLSDSRDVDGLFFDPSGLRAFIWADGVGSEWDLFNYRHSDGQYLRAQVAALTGTEYDPNARQLRVLTTGEWKATLAKISQCNSNRTAQKMVVRFRTGEREIVDPSQSPLFPSPVRTEADCSRSRPGAR